MAWREMYGEEVRGEMRKGTALQKNKQVKNSLLHNESFCNNK